MDHREVGRYWDRNAEVWTELSRLGWNVYRDSVNSPAFHGMLPDVAGKRGLDVGCGEGHTARQLTAKGAEMFGLDISPVFLSLAAALGQARYTAGSAQELPFGDAQFDFVTAEMCLMDLPDQSKAFQEIHRVLRPGGFLQFSIVHPCFAPPYRRLLRDVKGEAYAVEVGRYFDRGNGEIDRWIFSVPHRAKADRRPFEVPTFHRTLSEWLNVIIESGFMLEQLAEPHADQETAQRVPLVADTRVVSYFLHVRCRKPL